MSFENRVRETRRALSKGKSIDVYLDGIPTFRIGSIMHSNRFLNALESDAVIEIGKAKKWIECAEQSRPY